MIKNIPITSNQKTKLLEMFEYYFSDDIQTDALYALPDISEDGIIEYSTKQSKIHWYELLSNILIKKIFDNNFYWVNRYVVLCIQYFDVNNPHPIDFAYDKFVKVVNKEPLFNKADDVTIEAKEEKKQIKKVKTGTIKKELDLPVKAIGPIIEVTNKKLITDQEFFEI